MMRRAAMANAFELDLGTVFSHPNAWFTRAAETVSPSPGGEGRGEGGLQTKIKLLSEFSDRLLKLSQPYGVFSKSNNGGKWKLSGSREGFDARARRTAPEGGRGPQAF